MLPAPNLDDRDFQDLVDDAKRLVQQRCPEWSDHNVSDPGVTLIETFAMVVDQLLYRLNRVPDRLYVRFLDLLGVTLFPPVAATVPLTFWLSAPRESTVLIRAGTEALTPRTDQEDPIVFTTSRDLEIVACSLAAVATTPRGGEPLDRHEELWSHEGFACFAAVPREDDALLIGLSRATPDCAVALRFDCRVTGVGVDPRRPPLVWEAWSGSRWERCEVERDDTGGLNKPGDVVVHVPGSHVESVLARVRCGWLRCRVAPPAPRQPQYSTSPQIYDLAAFVIGGTVTAEHAPEMVRDEVVGVSAGVAGQRFSLARSPLVRSAEGLVVQVSGAHAWDDWRVVEHFGVSTEHDRHVVLDALSGEVVFGPAVRLPDGTVRHYGAVPPKGASIRVPVYRIGGGRRGNVGRGAIRTLRSSLPYVARIENKKAADGGVDGESVSEAKVRGPLQLRARDRAVTAADHEHLAVAASRSVARARCLADPEHPGAVRVSILRHAPIDGAGNSALESLRPGAEILEAVTRYLDDRRLIGTRLVVEPARLQGVTVVATIHARPRSDTARLNDAAVKALNTYLHPVVGGRDDGGWPFGRPIHAGELFAVLQRLDGVDLVEDVRLYPADARTGNRGQSALQVDLRPDAVPYSFDHQVRVVKT